MQVEISNIPGLTTLFQEEQKRGFLYVVTPENGTVTANDLQFFESTFDVAEHLYLEPERDLYDTHRVLDVLKALDLVSKNVEACKEFTDTTNQQPILDIGRAAGMFKKQHELINLLCSVDWYDVQECLRVLSATSTGTTIAREVWQEYAPGNLMPLPAELKDSVQQQKKTRTFLPPGSQKNSRKQ